MRGVSKGEATGRAFILRDACSQTRQHEEQSLCRSPTIASTTNHPFTMTPRVSFERTSADA